MRAGSAMGPFAAPLAQSAAPGGFYVGALGGYEGIDVESADGSVSANADSAVYGINAGYDLSLGSAFVGVEGELSTSGSSTDFPASFTGARDGLDANGQYYIGARAGVADDDHVGVPLQLGGDAVVDDRVVVHDHDAGLGAGQHGNLARQIVPPSGSDTTTAMLRTITMFSPSELRTTPRLRTWTTPSKFDSMNDCSEI